MTKILSANNKWAFFDGVASQINTIGTTSTFAWINQGIFRFEFDIIIPTSQVSNARVFYTTLGTTNGVTFLITNNVIKTSFYNNTTVGWTKTATAMVYNQSYHIVIYGTGTKARLYILSKDGSYLYDSGETALTIGTPSATQGNVAGFSLNIRITAYMRNFKIYQSSDTSNLKNYFPMQDNNNISKDVIGGLTGTVTSLNTIDINENGNWLYFNGVNSSTNIGTTSTLGWTNNGTFNIQFDAKFTKWPTGNAAVVSTATPTNSRYGFNFFIGTGGILYCYWMFYSSYNYKSATLVLGTMYNITMKGDGVNQQVIVTNLDTNNILYDSGLFAQTYNASATMQSALLLGNASVTNYNILLRNFKIYSDFAGTIPFMTLPLQNRDTLMLDTTGGLQGVSSNVSIINNNTNVLKAKNIFGDFDGASSYIQYANNYLFTFVSGDNDLPFVIEFDMYINSIASATYNWIIQKRNATTMEWQVLLIGGKLQIQLANPGQTDAISIYTTTSLAIKTLYHVKLAYTGSKTAAGLSITLNGVVAPTTVQNTGTYIGMTNTIATVLIGKYHTNTYYFDGFIRNLVITKNGTQVFNLPLQDTNNVSKEWVNGLIPTTVTKVNVVDLNDGGNWLYFNGVNSSANIGTTSTLGWMNTGVFNLQFDVRLFILTNGNRIFYTSATGGAGRYGFQFILNGTTVIMNWVVNSITTATLSSTAPILGTPYHYELKGNGTQIQLIITNLSTSAIHYDSGLISHTYYPLATTNLIPQWPSPANQHIRNFKIYSDFAGTIPFMTLTMQNRDNVMVDTTGGLVGIANNVSIINSNTNILRSKNLWAQFTPSVSTGTIGTTSTFGWMNTGVFNLQQDIILNSFAINSRTFQTTNTGGAARYGVTFQCNGTNLQMIWVANSVSVRTITPTQLVVGVPYRLILKGNGTQIQFIVINLNTNTLHYDSDLLSCAYIPFATTYTEGYFSDGKILDGYIKNLKVFTDFAGTIPFMNVPMQDGLNILKDVVGALQGTPTNIKIIEI